VSPQTSISTRVWAFHRRFCSTSELVHGTVEETLNAMASPKSGQVVYFNRCTAGSPEFSPYLPNGARLTCLRLVFSEWHSRLGLFLNICHAANSLELNGLRIENSCLPDFHIEVSGEGSFL